MNFGNIAAKDIEKYLTANIVGYPLTKFPLEKVAEKLVDGFLADHIDTSLIAISCEDLTINVRDACMTPLLKVTGVKQRTRFGGNVWGDFSVEFE